MRKLFLMLALLTAMSLAVFANEGDMSNGGKNCPSESTCIDDGETGNGNLAETVFQIVFANLKFHIR